MQKLIIFMHADALVVATDVVSVIANMTSLL